MPIWSYSINPSGYNEALIGTIIGALTLFSSEFSGKEITSVEMEDKVFHIKPFGEIGILVINGDKSDLQNTKIQNIVNKINASIDLLHQSEHIDLKLLDEETLKFYLNDLLISLEKVMDELAGKSPKQQHKVNILEINFFRKLQRISSDLENDEIGILVLDESLSELGTVTSEKVNKSILSKIKNHFVGWTKGNPLDRTMFPHFIFTKEYGVRIKIIKGIICIVVMKWRGGIGNLQDYNRLKSWTSLITKLIS